jgi:magnesium transporter
MIIQTYLNNGRLEFDTDQLHINPNAIWIDLFNPNENEKNEVQNGFHVELITPQESQEIESSSKYYESSSEVRINQNFLLDDNSIFTNEPVSFILKDNLLITQRSSDYKAFDRARQKVSSMKSNHGIEIFLTLLEACIDHDADHIEEITRRISRISKGLVKDKGTEMDRQVLLDITSLQESSIAIRENIIEKQRIISSMLKSRFFPDKYYETLRIMIKDVGSLLDYTSFNFDRLEFLQNTFLGLVDLEQNRIIKIFTVVTVIFMPPTLIASMYGMNFKFMPELDEAWGYPFAVFIMLFSSIFTLLFFKRKNWM